MKLIERGVVPAIVVKGRAKDKAYLKERGITEWLGWMASPTHDDGAVMNGAPRVEGRSGAADGGFDGAVGFVGGDEDVVGVFLAEAR